MSFFRLKRALLVGGAALVLAGSAIGIASAQQTPTPTPGGKTEHPLARQFLETMAAKLGVTPEKLQQAFTETRKELGAQRPWPGFRGHRGWGVLGHELTVAAQAIGITADQLRQELPGKSLAEVARSHGKDPKVVADALKADAHTKIDQRIDSLMERQVPVRGQARQSRS